MRQFYAGISFSWVVIWTLSQIPLSLYGRKPEKSSVDLFIFDAGPCGLAAAISASRLGLKVVVGHTTKMADYGPLVASHNRIQVVRTGIYQELRDSVNKKLNSKKSDDKHKADSSQLLKVYKRVIAELLKKNGIEVKWNWYPDSVWMEKTPQNPSFQVIRLTRSGRNPGKQFIIASYCIDAGIEGQLMSLFPCRYLSNGDYSLDNLLNDQWQIIKPSDLKDKNFKRLQGMHWLRCQDYLGENENLKSGHIIGHSVGVGYLHGLEDQPLSIPFGIMVPTQRVRLLCPGPVSVSAGCFIGIQQVPNQIVLGQAAGTAAFLGIKKRLFPSQISISAVQQNLLIQGVELIYLNQSFSPEDSLFYPIQRLGLLNCFPNKQLDLNQPFSDEELKWLSERTGLTLAEIMDTVQQLTKKESLPRIWKILENQEKQP